MPAGRHLDNRISLRQQQAPAEVAPTGEQRSARARLRRTLPDLRVDYDAYSGVGRTVSNAAGYLTSPDPQRDPLDIGLRFVQENLDVLGLGADDVAEYRISDRVYSSVSGATHIYLQQSYRGLPVYNGQLQLHVNREGRLISLNNAFVPQLADAVSSERPTLGASQAVVRAAQHLGVVLPAVPRETGQPSGPGRRTGVEHAGVSRRPIEASLMWLPIRRGEVRLVWNFQVFTLDGEHAYDFTVDAKSGDVWTRFDWISDAQYRVYPRPVQSPDHTIPAPPADGRVLAVDPADPVASPFGWHDTDGVPGAELSLHQGNNVHAYDDLDYNNLPPAVQPDCGPALTCDFPIALGNQPEQYTDAAVTNLFYWTNLVHDVQYQYGFDEAAGNFQVNNYGGTGIAGDPLLAEAQDGLTLNNARISVGPDGQSPRMEMFTWSLPTVYRVTVREPAGIAGDYAATYGAFGAALSPLGLRAGVVLVDDRTGNPSDACEEIKGSSLRDAIALIDRGTCSFVTQVRNAQEAGAVAAVIVNDSDEPLSVMPNDGTGSDITIASFLISRSDGDTIKSALAGGVIAKLRYVGEDTHAATVHPPSSVAEDYLAVLAAFGPALSEAGVTGDVVLVDDGDNVNSLSTEDACEPLVNAAEVQGKIALISAHLSCNSVTKARNAQNAGAIAALITYWQDVPVSLPGSEPDDDIVIPVVSIGLTDAETLRSGLAEGVTATLRFVPAAVLRRDSDLANDVIVHEYAHGVTIRQVGGPSNATCLVNYQQPGEGWSDWFSLVYTHEVDDTGIEPRGVATFLLQEPTDGPGLRPQPYSTDPTVNTWTYESIGSGLPIPHGTGAVWAQALWEVYWALVDVYGFDPDLHNALGGSGNQRMMLYVNEGLKNTACFPTFVDARDGIIQAAVDNYGGADVCLLWEAFAAFGLGTDASGGPDPNSLQAINGFAVPVSCLCDPAPAADAGPDQTICMGVTTSVGTPAQPDTSYVWAPGGESTAQILVSPTASTTYTVTATVPACEHSVSDAATVTVQDGTDHGMLEDFEDGAAGWTATGFWHLVTDSSCAQPGYATPRNAMYYGQDDTCDYDTGFCATAKPKETCGPNNGELYSPWITGVTPGSTVSFDYFRHVENYVFGHNGFDAAALYVRPERIGLWWLLWYKDSRDVSQQAWINSGPIALPAELDDDTIQLAFAFDTVDDANNNLTGWFIDNVVVTGESVCGNAPPDVRITAPVNGATVAAGSEVTFTGFAFDHEDGALSGSLSWTSSLDGPLGTGGRISTAALTVGVHTITASLTDSGGMAGSASVELIVQ